MSENTTAAEEEKIRRITMRLAQMQAKSALRAMRTAARTRTRLKREHAQRRSSLGDAVMDAGLGEWSHGEVLGLLLAGRDHFGASDAARALFTQRARRHQPHATSSMVH
jgi:hypothetical protein